MICIIGAGLAGDSAAAALRAAAYTGSITLIGDEPERPYDRPPLSKAALVEGIPEERVRLRPETWYAEHRIVLKTGSAVTSIDRNDRRLTLADSTTLTYDKLLIATGARARSLPGVAAPALPTFQLRTLDDARRLRAHLRPGARIAIIGAGVIGLEVAASAVKSGCSVEVVELADRVMSRVMPPAISAYVAACHRSKGVRLHLAIGKIELSDQGVMTKQAGLKPADAVVVGIGVTPNSELAAAASLACQDGILVDEYCRTSDPDIFAAGDVARYPCPFGHGAIRCENWKHAELQAGTAARNMLGQSERYSAVSSMWSDQYDLKLQAAGYCAESGEILRGDVAAGRFMQLYLDPAGHLAGAVALNMPKDFRFAQALIEKRVVVDPQRLADSGQDLRKLAA